MNQDPEFDFAKVKTVAIIGAGVAGLVTAKTLREEGVECTIFERNDALGGVWTNGYLDYGVQVPKELYEFPDFPMPDDAPQFTPGPYFQKYLEEYAAKFDVARCIRFSAPVERAEPGEDGTEWTVTYRDNNDSKSELFDLVVVCVGLYSNIPYLPEVPGHTEFQGSVHHISDLKSPDLLTGKRVAVVGFGKSATDAALAARDHAQSTHIIVRKLHWPVPRKLAGILPFKWGLLNRLAVTMIPLYKNPTQLERAVHRFGQPLVWLFWRVVELLLYVQCGLGSNGGKRESLVPDEPIEIGAFSEATMVPRPDFYAAVRSDDIQLRRGSVSRFVPSGIELSDGTKLEVDQVIFATGWRSDYSYLSDEQQNLLGFADDGAYLYRQMIHPNVPGLIFIGYASTISNILAYCMQARWLAALISGQHRLPDRDAQMREIELLKVWKRSWMPFSHARAARLIVHLQHYLDELLLDFGANPLRKKGVFAPLAEVFAPYQPSDYRSLAEKDWAEKELR